MWGLLWTAAFRGSSSCHPKLLFQPFPRALIFLAFLSSSPRLWDLMTLPTQAHVLVFSDFASWSQNQSHCLLSPTFLTSYPTDGLLALLILMSSVPQETGFLPSGIHYTPMIIPTHIQSPFEGKRIPQPLSFPILQHPLIHPVECCIMPLYQIPVAAITN